MMFLFLTGFGLLPGGHRQFMITIIEIIPFCLLMIGPDPIIYLNTYAYIWNMQVDGKYAYVRHLTHLALCFYLMTIGPNPLRAAQTKISRAFWSVISPLRARRSDQIDLQKVKVL